MKRINVKPTTQAQAEAAYDKVQLERATGSRSGIEIAQAMIRRFTK